jgi:NADPH-dependent curcumin reductase CurA
MPQVNKQITLAARPSGMPKPSDFKLVESSVPEAKAGEILVRLLYVSVDPYMRGRMNDVKSYAPPAQIGEVMGAGAVGLVVNSQSAQFETGDFVEGFFGWQEYAISDGKGVRKLDPSLGSLSTALGVLGIPGLTAYFGLLDIGKPQRGETVVVSGAAGAVGSIAGQIAKINGCRVVGIAGSDQKIACLRDELGFDAAFNYKTTPDYYAELEELCPNGVDVYFDNVGGPITDAVFRFINTGARIVLCGQIAQYNDEKPGTGPRLLSRLIVKQARAEGFLVFQFAPRYAEGLKQMAAWLKAGKLKYREQFVDGIENTPRAFIGMLQGENTGKQLVRVAKE